MDIRRLKAGEAGAFVDLIRAGLGAVANNQTIYGTSGIAKYIEASAEAPADLSATKYFTAADGDHLVGAAEIATAPTELFLNYISIAPSKRGTGLGSRLYLSMLETCLEEVGSPRLGLDVFADNHRALGWYESLGFSADHHLDWYDLPIAPLNGSSPLPVRGLPQADLCQAAYGFSEFVVVGDSQPYRVGRLGDIWFRLTDADAATDPHLHATLARLDADRRILLVTRRRTNEDLDPLLRIRESLRMSADTLVVLRSLRAKLS